MLLYLEARVLKGFGTDMHTPPEKVVEEVVVELGILMRYMEFEECFWWTKWRGEVLEWRKCV